MAAWCLNSSIAGQVAATLISSQVRKSSEGYLFQCVQCFLVVVVVSTIVGLLIKSDLSFFFFFTLIRLRINDMYVLSPPNIVAFSV